jgi:deoxycytidylate deaminase
MPQVHGVLNAVDASYLATAARVAGRSFCQRSGVGAVLVWRGRTIATGWNSGPADHCALICPRGRKTHAELPRTAPYTGEGFCVAVHAEVATVSMALGTRYPREVFVESTLYVSKEPCADCQSFLASLELEVLWR